MTMEKFLTVDRSINILDVGCGTGLILKQLHKKGFKNLAGIDINNEAIKEALKNDEKINFYCMSVEELAWNYKEQSKKFDEMAFPDVIICNQILEHVREIDSFMSSVQELLSFNGLLCGSVPFELSRNSDNHIRAFNQHDINKILTSYFVNVEISTAGIYPDSIIFFECKKM